MEERFGHGLEPGTDLYKLVIKFVKEFYLPKEINLSGAEWDRIRKLVRARKCETTSAELRDELDAIEMRLHPPQLTGPPAAVEVTHNRAEL